MEQITAVDFYIFRGANVSVYCAIAYTVLYQSSKSNQYLKSNQYSILVSGDSPKIMWKLWLSTKFPHYEVWWNYGILRNVT